MNDPSNTPKKFEATTEPVRLRCTVLITGTVIGRLKVAKGHRCQLLEAQAKALASLNPPAVRIDGI
ncbi:MAG: hypothetical protein EOP84_06795 [Verrucomicrobiaceae bacterium]|nr:MAG: hypothetical protein EOP84_06795 [Verrucomicrobiaceae bacterium]